MAKKLTKRKAFNFLRSYFDVLNEIPEDSDKLKFLISIIDKQFLDEDPKELNFITNLCYESQRHSIEKSVKGWISVNKTDLLGNPLPDKADPKGDPKADPKGDPTLPIQQEEEEEQGKEQVKGEDEDEKPSQKLDEDVIYDIERLKEYYINFDRLVNAVCKKPENKLSKEILITRLEKFNSHLSDTGTFTKKWNDYTSHFLRWHKKNLIKSTPKHTQYL